MDFRWPPELSEEELIFRHTQIKDWQITHGSLIKLIRTDDGHSVLSRPIGLTMFPTLFPRSSFTRALALQKIYNELYVRVAEDEIWLREALKDLISSDKLCKALWSIHEEVRKVGYAQSRSLGVFRSDYMLHRGDGGSRQGPADGTNIKQVEFNSFSVAGGSHANIVVDMHRHLERVDAAGLMSAAFHSTIPPNSTINSIVEALKLAHHAYASSQVPEASSDGLDLAILMVVQPNNINICDERPLEQGLWNQEPPIPIYRVEFPDEVLDDTSLDGSRRLLFKPFPDAQPNRVFEVSVIYLRAGYDAEEYSDRGIAARLQLEKSCAIKCPSVLSHLTTFKKVQQVLARPGTLERFLTRHESVLISNTFVPMLPLDTSELGLLARKLATDPTTAVNYVLKPSLEGGGHNVYGEEISAYLQSIDVSLWPHYILQEMIKPPRNVYNILLSHRGIYRGSVVSELGVFGTVLWRRTEAGRPPEILHNTESAGWSFKTKPSEMDEISVIKGYGCFDCPYLVDSNDDRDGDRARGQTLKLEEV